MSFENAVRLISFLGLLLLFAAWELGAPRRELTRPRAGRWLANLSLFVFDTAASSTNVDTIVNFSVADDTIQLVRSTNFMGLPAAGTLAASAFWSGAGATSAHDADDRVVLDTTTGALYYDADGAGGMAAVQFATLVGVVGTLTNADFVMV